MKKKEKVKQVILLWEESQNTSNIEINVDSKAANKIQYWLIKHDHWFENHRVDQRH